ncbi:hypothetical protein [Sutcliffiella halmapala]|uniref:hypothetical protein n=1 Tax=Sutcliffiella halmapala TaxID=79882 RepID=UPI000994D58E|nr:hypothetical protein [Sutcliffiella halmapala]
MNIWQLLQHRIPESLEVKTNNSLEKLTGIFQAKVTEQLDDSLFSIQKGTVSYEVKIVGAVEIGKEYQFRSKTDGNALVLTVENQIAPSEKTRAFIPSSKPVESNQLQATLNRVEQLVSQLGVKMPDSTLREIVKTIESYTGTKKEIAMELTKFSLARNVQLPQIVPSSLNMLTSSFLDNETMFSTLEQIKHIQKSSNNTSPEIQTLQRQLESITTHIPLNSKQDMLLFVKTLITNLGLNYEHGLTESIVQQDTLSKLKLEQLKPILLELSQRMIHAEEKGTIAQLVSKITGFQLLNREDGLLNHVFLPIPVQLEKEAKEWYIQISSKKKKSGVVDPEYCRIVLFIDLPIFSSTMIDLLVQQKVITLTIHHSYAPIETLVEKGIPLLKENLSQKGYTLSTIKTIPKNEEEQEEISLRFFKKILSSSEEGVDVRI